MSGMEEAGGGRREAGGGRWEADQTGEVGKKGKKMNGHSRK